MVAMVLKFSDVKEGNGCLVMPHAEITPRLRACVRVANVPRAESMLVLADMGVQLTTHYAFGGKRYRFIDIANIQVCSDEADVGGGCCKSCFAGRACK